MNEGALQLVEQHRDYVRALAKQIARGLPPEVDLDELIASGQVGLVEAAQRYEPRHGVAFQTYAYYRIRGAIFDGLRKMLWLPPTLYRQIRFRAGADQIAREQAAAGAADDDPDSQADRLATAVRDMAAIYVLSLDSEQVESDTVADDAGPAEVAEQREVVQQLREAIDTLPERKQLIIRGYYFEGRKLTEIAGDLGVSRFQASRLHTEAIRELRGHLESHQDQPPP